MPKPWIDFTALRHRARFEPVLTHYGLTPEGRGPQKTLLCPFHDETAPSCKVNVEKRAFHCFGCGAKGNILDFVAKMENVALTAAAATLAEICAIPLSEVSREQEGARSARTRAAEPHRTPQETREATTTRQTPIPPAQTPLCEHPDAPQAIVDARSEPTRPSQGRTTQATLAREDAPREAEDPINPPLTFRLKLDPTHPYLAERGVSPQTAEAFGLGFCARGMMKGRICIPIHNGSGELVAYAGRWPGDSGWPQGEDKYKLPPGFRKSHVLFNLDGVAQEWKGDALVIVEGFFSVFRLRARLGLPVVALMGCSLSDEQTALLQRCAHRLRYITVLMDGDAAGRTARSEIVQRLTEHFSVRAPLLPEGTSPDTLDDDTLMRLVAGRPLP